MSRSDREQHVGPDPAPDGNAADPPVPADAPETCDVCGSTDIVEIRCKYVCRNCRTILRTCSDL